MTPLLWPLLICLIGALAAGAYGRPALNRRLSITSASWLLAVFPLGALIVLVWLTGQLNGAPLTASVPWLPTLGLSVSLYFDSFSASVCAAGRRYRCAGDRLRRLLPQR